MIHRDQKELSELIYRKHQIFKALGVFAKLFSISGTKAKTSHIESTKRLF